MSERGLSRSRFKETLRKELKRVRGKATEVAIDTGISETTLSHWISAENTAVPTAEKALLIAQSLGVSLEYLITGEKQESRIISPDIEEALNLLNSLPPEMRSVAIKQIRALAESIGVDDSSKQRQTG
ncbi:helix-turn-helix domain-containing protein [Alkalispirochaeta alkalica]|uniref:helix-turn-helix domain-containing protein n=1 Tax=Alkalispirochaeta alkalica TaxID=46356 RepID=UPI0003637C0C